MFTILKVASLYSYVACVSMFDNYKQNKFEFGDPYFNILVSTYTWTPTPPIPPVPNACFILARITSRALFSIQYIFCKCYSGGRGTLHGKIVF